MSFSKSFKRGLALLGLVAVAATASASNASAFGRMGAGPRVGGGVSFNSGVRFGHVGVGHVSVGHVNIGHVSVGPRFVGAGLGHQAPGSFKPFGSLKLPASVFHPGQHKPVVSQTVCFHGKPCGGLQLPPKHPICGFLGCGPVVNHCKFSANPMCHPAKEPCWISHTCGRPIGPIGPVICRFGRCFPVVTPVVVQPVVIPQPIYPRPVYRPVYPVAGPSYAPAPAPAAYSAPAPAVQQPTSLSVVFQPTATSADITNFIRSYNVTVSTGPDANGIYRLQISAGPVAQDQLNQIVQSMRSQTNIVAQVGA